MYWSRPHISVDTRKILLVLLAFSQSIFCPSTFYVLVHCFPNSFLLLFLLNTWGNISNLSPSNPIIQPQSNLYLIFHTFKNSLQYLTYCIHCYCTEYCCCYWRSIPLVIACTSIVYISCFIAAFLFTLVVHATAHCTSILFLCIYVICSHARKIMQVENCC